MVWSYTLKTHVSWRWEGSEVATGAVEGSGSTSSGSRVGGQGKQNARMLKIKIGNLIGCQQLQLLRQLKLGTLLVSDACGEQLLQVGHSTDSYALTMPIGDSSKP